MATPAGGDGMISSASLPRVDDEIPPWTMACVDPARMKTMAAILRDPYPVHWDRAGNERAGLGPRLINQGPLNVGYLANMLMAWAGPTCVRRLTVAFADRVHDGDKVTARGTVTGIETDGPEPRLTCEIWLERDGLRVVTGTAIVGVALTPPVEASASK